MTLCACFVKLPQVRLQLTVCEELTLYFMRLDNENLQTKKRPRNKHYLL